MNSNIINKKEETNSNITALPKFKESTKTPNHLKENSSLTEDKLLPSNFSIQPSSSILNTRTTINDKSHKYISESNYDSSRVKNTNFYISYPPSNFTQRNINLFLFKILIEEYQKNQKLRDIDLYKSKSQNIVSSFSKTSKIGHHVRYGESINVNQDVAFIYENFLLIQHFFVFGICDGHGECGELIASHAKDYIPAHIQYIEMDNNVTKHNKSIHNIITSLYSVSEKSYVKEMNIVKYFSEKFAMNVNDISFLKQNFNDISHTIKEAFYNANNDLIKQKFDIKNSGCTVCMLFLYGNRLICANVGDSRAIICSCNSSSNWKVSQLTQDHKPTNVNEMKRIEQAGGIVERCKYEDNDKEYGPYRVWFKDTSQGPGLAMSRSYGDYTAKQLGVVCEPDVFEYKIEHDDKCVIVASDGLWEYLSNKDVMDIVNGIYSKKGNASEASEKLCTIARDKWKMNTNKTIDDITCVVLFFKQQHE